MVNSQTVKAQTEKNSTQLKLMNIVWEQGKRFVFRRKCGRLEENALWQFTSTTGFYTPQASADPLAACSIICERVIPPFRKGTSGVGLESLSSCNFHLAQGKTNF